MHDEPGDSRLAGKCMSTLLLTGLARKRESKFFGKCDQGGSPGKNVDHRTMNISAKYVQPASLWTITFISIIQISKM